jgi:hypothetical protein
MAKFIPKGVIWGMGPVRRGGKGPSFPNCGGLKKRQKDFDSSVTARDARSISLWAGIPNSFA